MYKKTALVVALSAIVLAGCGDEEARPINNPTGDESQDEVRDETRNETHDETQESGPRNDESEGVNEESEVKPGKKKDEVIGDDESDMPDKQGQLEEDTDLNK